jgi:hypothetical protein
MTKAHAGAACALILLISPLGPAAFTPPLAAQDTSERPDGIICQTPDCELRRSLPKEGLAAPLNAADVLVDPVKTTLASDLDPRLPASPFEQWLYTLLYPAMAANRTSVADWPLGFCEERQSAIPGAGPDLCVEVSAPLLLELGAPRGGGLPVELGQRVVKILIRVADGVYAPGGRTGWIPRPPQIQKIYIERLEGLQAIDSLDVTSLAELESQLAVPFDRWPTVDLESSIAWTPEKPVPGDIVTFRITVENRGKRDAERASVHLLLGVSLPCCDQNVKEIRREWFPHVPAGGSMSFEISAQLPRGDAIASVSVSPGPSLAKVREANAGNNDTMVVVPTASRTSEPPR